MKKLLNLLTLGVALAAGGCAGLLDDNLARAYKSGSLSASEYHRLRIQQEAISRQQYLRAQEVNEQGRSAIMSQYIQTINNTPSVPLNITPISPQGSGFGGHRNDQVTTAKLPSGFDLDDMQKGRGIRTGKSQLGQDGKFWYEYRTINGSTYWSFQQ